MSEEDRLKLVETANRLEPLATGELLGFGFDVADLIDSVTRLFYSVVMAVSILYQGGMARYFLERRNDVAIYLASPDWARSLAQSMHRQN